MDECLVLASALALVFALAFSFALAVSSCSSFDCCFGLRFGFDVGLGTCFDGGWMCVSRGAWMDGCMDVCTDGWKRWRADGNDGK